MKDQNDRDGREAREFIRVLSLGHKWTGELEETGVAIYLAGLKAERARGRETSEPDATRILGEMVGIVARMWGLESNNPLSEMARAAFELLNPGREVPKPQLVEDTATSSKLSQQLLEDKPQGRELARRILNRLGIDRNDEDAIGIVVSEIEHEVPKPPSPAVYPQVDFQASKVYSKVDERQPPASESYGKTLNHPKLDISEPSADDAAFDVFARTAMAPDAQSFRAGIDYGKRENELQLAARLAEGTKLYFESRHAIIELECKLKLSQAGGADNIRRLGEALDRIAELEAQLAEVEKRGLMVFESKNRIIAELKAQLAEVKR